MPKSYSAYQYSDLKDLGLEVRLEKIFNDVPPLEPTELLKAILEINTKQALITEKAKSEFIIAPVLFEIARRNVEKISFFSGHNLNVDKLRGLHGFCDFLFSNVPRTPFVRQPVFCVVEAKNDNLEKGIPQCVAEMFAARIFNQNEGKEVSKIFGCVTVGREWLFLKMENEIVVRDTDVYVLNELPLLLGVLQIIVDSI